jgi:hypothetical protein
MHEQKNYSQTNNRCTSYIYLTTTKIPNNDHPIEANPTPPATSTPEHSLSTSVQLNLVQPNIYNFWNSELVVIFSLFYSHVPSLILFEGFLTMLRIVNPFVTRNLVHPQRHYG